jgi:hypothetical protein
VHPRDATQVVASNHTSLQRWDPEPPLVPRPRTSPPYRGELRCCHVSCGPKPRLLAELSSGAATRPMAPVSTSSRGGLRRFHVPHGPQQAVDHRNKERPSCPRYAAGLACVQSTAACYRCACKTCGHTATVRFNSATQTQLTTPGYGYSSDTTRQDDTTTLTMFSIASEET